MSTYLSAVKYDVKSNTLEASWITEAIDTEGTVVSLPISKCKNYSSDQVSDFNTDLGPDATKYVSLFV